MSEETLSDKIMEDIKICNCGCDFTRDVVCKEDVKEFIKRLKARIIKETKFAPLELYSRKEIIEIIDKLAGDKLC